MDLAMWGQRFVGRVIDHRYQIEGVLSSGGMGAITRTRQLRVDRSVVLKLVPLSRSDLVKRLQSEARILAAVPHPSIVDVYDFGEDALAGVSYLAERFLEGRNLQEDLDAQGPWDASRARDLILPVLEGLAHVHHHGIVHCDLKPENLMLVQGLTGSEQVILVDFGIAKWKHKPDTDPSPGVTLGSPCVMSPEQIRGEDSVGPPSDVWSMGVVFFSLLTGKSPFQGASIEHTLREVLHGPVPWLKDLCPWLSTSLAAVVRKAMERSLVDRYSSTKAFAADLRRCDLYASISRSKREDQKLRLTSLETRSIPSPRSEGQNVSFS